MANSPKKLPYVGKGLIDEASMINQGIIHHLVDVLKTPGLAEVEIFRRIGIAIDDLHQISHILRAIPVECAKEANKIALDESQSEGQKNIQLQEV